MVLDSNGATPINLAALGAMDASLASFNFSDLSASAASATLRFALMIA
jgi:hypothetical protein